MAKRILIVEDCEVNAELLRWILEDEGYETILVESGEDCLELVRTQTIRFDLVLMDINLPGISGVEATKQIKEAGIDVPVIALTADVFRTNKEKSLFDGFLTKPVQLSALSSEIARSVNKQQLP